MSKIESFKLRVWLALALVVLLVQAYIHTHRSVGA